MQLVHLLWSHGTQQYYQYYSCDNTQGSMTHSNSQEGQAMGVYARTRMQCLACACAKGIHVYDYEGVYIYIYTFLRGQPSGG